MDIFTFPGEPERHGCVHNNARTSWPSRTACWIHTLVAVLAAGGSWHFSQYIAHMATCKNRQIEHVIVDVPPLSAVTAQVRPTPQKTLDSINRVKTRRHQVKDLSNPSDSRPQRAGPARGRRSAGSMIPKNRAFEGVKGLTKGGKQNSQACGRSNHGFGSIDITDVSGSIRSTINPARPKIDDDHSDVDIKINVSGEHQGDAMDKVRDFRRW